MLVKPGKVLDDGRYRLIESYGANERAGLEFWRAHDTRLTRDVALTLLLGDSADPDAAANGRSMSSWVRRAGTESAALARVLDVLGPDDLARSEGLLCLVVAEWTEGVELREITRRGPVAPLAACRLLRPLVGAADQAHHTAVMLGIDGPDRIRVNGQGMATLAFPGPAPGSSARADVRGLGELLYLLLTGAEAGTTTPHRVPRDLSLIAMLSLDDTSAGGIRTCGPLLSVLDRVIRDEVDAPAPEPPAPPREPEPRPVRRASLSQRFRAIRGDRPATPEPEPAREPEGSGVINGSIPIAWPGASSEPTGEITPQPVADQPQGGRHELPEDHTTQLEPVAAEEPDAHTGLISPQPLIVEPSAPDEHRQEHPHERTEVIAPVPLSGIITDPQNPTEQIATATIAAEGFPGSAIPDEAGPESHTRSQPRTPTSRPPNRPGSGGPDNRGRIAGRRRLAVLTAVLTVGALALVVWMGTQIAGFFNADKPEAGSVAVSSSPSAGREPLVRPTTTVPPTTPPSSAAPPPPAPIGVSGAQEYLVSGSPDNPGKIGLAVDGNPGTGWPTAQYRQQFPSFLPGIGVMITFNQPERVTSVAIDSPSAGTVVELHAAPSTDPSLGDTQVLGTATLTSGTTTIPVNMAAPTGHLLVWITQLGPGSGGYQTTINEITCLGTP